MKDRIASVDKTREILEKYQINPKSRYGQNFLVSHFIPELVSSLDCINSESLVIEIGPGLGSLTQYLLEKAKKVICYEIDNSLCNILSETLKDYNNLEIINKDFLDVNLNNLDIKNYSNIVFVSNLPYYITSDILIKLLKCDLNCKIVAMMQKEVAKRILDKSDINELVLYSHLFSNVSKIHEVSKNDFFPKPNVDSTVLLFDKYQIDNKEQYAGIIESLYSQRRKTINNNLKKINSHNINRLFIDYVLKNNNLSINSRIDDLNINQVIDLVNFIKDNIYLKCPAKLNIGLNILGKENNMHLIKSIFVPINLFDYLEVYLTSDSSFKLNSNKQICDEKENSLYKVFEELNNNSFGLFINLTKNIPLGSGLGGGSSDAGTLLKYLGNILNINNDKLIDIALKISSDAVFFLDPKTKLLDKDLRTYKNYQIDLSSYNIHLYLNNINSSTKDAYAKYDSLNLNIKEQDFSNFLSLTNDLEKPFELIYGKNKKVPKKSSKIVFSSLSGAGSSYYVLIDKNLDDIDDESLIVEVLN